MNAVPGLPRVVAALGITQIIGWGSLYYSVTVLAAPMAAGLSCDPSWVFAGFSAALGASGLAAPATGRAIDRLGGRTVLSAGSLLASAGLLLLASASNLPWMFAGWLLIGLAMTGCLYEAAFPALSQLAGARYRSALTALTLFGGLASTAFWPLAWHLNEAMGWRQTLAAFAALNLVVCLPLHRYALPRAPGLQPMRHDTTSTDHAPLSRQQRLCLMWLMTAFTLNAFVFTAIGAHVVGALNEVGGSKASAVWIAALIGPLQLAGRMLEFAFARHVSARKVGMACFALTALALLLLWQATVLSGLALLFVILYGAANGVMTIVRGTVPVELFGRAQFGRINGQLAAPAFFAKASAPMLIALLLDQGGSYKQMALVLAAISTAAFIIYLKADRLVSDPGNQI
ncbi:MFS transporter [Niveibacterium sp. 24ML]|uniref:MFS transporter n=1 Tax=Niveibacterium sp. 24ML TaxID=2985512 RepID=UPI00226E9E90|nr:MFS transporter [Niveibacterium sp. 24ML]MCX9156066.1 MFS transporter [Niveibacterium sp. 24ML]